MMTVPPPCSLCGAHHWSAHPCLPLPAPRDELEDAAVSRYNAFKSLAMVVHVSASRADAFARLEAALARLR